MFILNEYNEPTHRSCTKCGEMKSVTQYGKRAMGGFGFASICRSCVALKATQMRPKYYQQYKGKPRDLTQEQALHMFDYSEGKLYWKNPTSLKIKKDDEAGFFSENYYKVSVNNKKYSIHQIVYLMFHGYIPKEIDHINCVKTDNRIENLREVTRKQNMQNKSLPKTNTSGVKNVSWKAPIKKWAVSLSVDGKKKHIGVFKDLELAELVAIEARNKYHGEYANHGLGV